MNTPMQFDVIVGNPPYQGGDLGHSAYKSLWPVFWKKCLELTKPDGFVYLVTPTTWCSPTSDLAPRDSYNRMTRLWDVFQSFTSKANISDIKRHFPGVGSSFGIVSVDKSGRDGLSFSDGRQSQLGFIPMSGSDEVHANLSHQDNISSRHIISAKAETDYQVTLFKSRKVCDGNVKVLAKGERFDEETPETLFVSINTNTKDEAIIVRDRVLECAEILNRHCRYNGFIDQKILGMIKL
jgi:hypothetical protein